MTGIAEPRLRRISVLIMCLALAAGLLATRGDEAGAFTGGSISPTLLSADGQRFEITYSGKDPGTVFPTPNMIVEQCIADDTKPGFNPNGFDCSPLSRQNFFDVPESGMVVYGGNPLTNPTAPFVGIDDNNLEWSFCDENSGVTNYQEGFFRLADSPTDQADDIFIPFTCEFSTVPTTTSTTPTSTTTTTPPDTVPDTTTTTVPDTTTTTTATTTTTLGDGSTTTTTSDGTTTTTTLGDGTTTTTLSGDGDGSGDGGGLGRSGAAALARTGLGAWPMMRLALLLLFVGTWLKARADGARPGQALGSWATAPWSDKGMP